MSIGLVVRIAILSVVLASCSGGGEEATSPEPSGQPTTAAPATTAEAKRLPDGFEPEAGAVTPECVQGWRRPERDATEVNRALRVIRRTQGVKGPFSLQDFREFVGPEAPPNDKGYLQNITRYYVKGHLERDPAFRGRWLVEVREFGSGVAAMAPYDTDGFSSPDWRGFQWSPELKPKAFEGLPGEWVGVPYDFVRGGADLEFPGLPKELQGCMKGT